jgi:hypothetical protein
LTVEPHSSQALLLGLAIVAGACWHAAESIGGNDSRV